MKVIYNRKFYMLRPEIHAIVHAKARAKQPQGLQALFTWQAFTCRDPKISFSIRGSSNLSHSVSYTVCIHFFSHLPLTLLLLTIITQCPLIHPIIIENSDHPRLLLSPQQPHHRPTISFSSCPLSKVITAPRPNLDPKYEIQPKNPFFSLFGILRPQLRLSLHLIYPFTSVPWYVYRPNILTQSRKSSIIQIHSLKKILF